jgi:hypothetical protein
MTSWNLVGQLTMGACVPSCVAAVGAIEASAGVSAGEVAAKLAGVLEAQATVSVTPVNVIGALEAALAVALPSVIIDGSAFGAVIAELQSTLGTLQLNVDLGAAIAAQLGVPGVWLYSVQGAAEDIIPGGIPGVSAPVQGVILLASDAGAIAAIQAIMRTG